MAGGHGELDMEDINDQVRARMEKLQLWRSRGVDPFGIRYEVTHRAAEIADRFDELEGSTVSIAGRVMARRGHGRAAFLDIRDLSGKIQLYASVDELGEELYQLLLEIDIGDIIGVKGKVFRTRRGEVSVSLLGFTLLGKALRPLPEKWHGLQDIELRYRHRYLDLVVNPEVREVFVKRSLIVRYIREFLDARGFLEVETPMMHPIPGGAAARPFVTHHNTLDVDLYLRIAPELYLKRLLVGGLERVYEINRCFRNEGVSTRHNPEFTTVEVYQAYADYTDMMSLTEHMVAFVAESVLGTRVISYGGREVDLTPPWRRVTMVDAVREWTGIDFTELESDDQAQ
jgi:lysyl-tRNA synthetase class 2